MLDDIQGTVISFCEKCSGANENGVVDDDDDDDDEGSDMQSWLLKESQGKCSAGDHARLIYSLLFVLFWNLFLAGSLSARW